MTKLLSASIALLAICTRVRQGGQRRTRAATGARRSRRNRAAAQYRLPPRPSTADGQPSVNAQGAATLEFQKRIDAYLKIHNEAEGKVPNLKRTDDPKEISDREKALGRR